MGKKTTKSNLLLNLLIEVRTQSIKMKDKNKNKILVVHKPYGQNERVTLGP